MVEPALLGKVINVAALCHNAAVLIAAAASLTHVEGNFVFRAVGGCEVKVCGEHAGRHVAQLAADDVPWAGVELLFYAVARELYDTACHVFPFVAGVTGDAAEPAGLFAQLRDVERLIERGVDIVLLLLWRTGDGHIHHVGNAADGFRAFFPARFKDPHDLK